MTNVSPRLWRKHGSSVRLDYSSFSSLPRLRGPLIAITQTGRPANGGLRFCGVSFFYKQVAPPGLAISHLQHLPLPPAPASKPSPLTQAQCH